MPGKQTESDDHSDTILSEGIEYVHPRYAIVWHNNRMRRHSDYVVTYIPHSWGDAALFTRTAQHQKKGRIDLAL